MRFAPAAYFLPLTLLAVSACSDTPDAPEPDETSLPEGMESAAPPPQADEDGEPIEIIGTPMADRVADHRFAEQTQ